MMFLFIDDERDPVGEGWAIARSFEEAIRCIKNSFPEYISFDHDLGEEKTGYDIAKKIADMILDGTIPDPGKIKFFVHSQNPIGKINIETYLDNWNRHR